MPRISMRKGGHWQKARLAGGVLALLILTFMLGGCPIPGPGSWTPTATITSPTDGATFTVGTPITFQGSATDREDGALTGDSLLWFSNLFGEIGTGESVTRNDLGVGAHRITLTATDSGGASTTPWVWITVQDPVVTFPDPNLERVIREHINKPTDPILRSDLIALTLLDADRENISDLTGMEHLTNLTGLGLSENQISDITPLDGLTNLTGLGLRENQISDITPLAGLTNLTVLELLENRISNLAPLAGLTNLTVLCLRENQISDITPLDGLTNLTWLRLSTNQISDITPLDGLTNLTILELGENRISNLAPLAGLTNLTALALRENQISDITPLAGLTNLRDLALDSNQISDLAPLVANTGLGAGDQVGLRENPLDLTPGSQNMRDIEELRRRGVDVIL